MNTSIQDDTDLAKEIINSVLRDFFAAAVASGIHASHVEGFPDPHHVTEKSYENADILLAASHTPELIAKIKKL